MKEWMKEERILNVFLEGKCLLFDFNYFNLSL